MLEFRLTGAAALDLVVATLGLCLIANFALVFRSTDNLVLALPIAIFGGLVLSAVFGYTVWQVCKYRRGIEAGFIAACNGRS